MYQVLSRHFSVPQNKASIGHEVKYFSVTATLRAALAVDAGSHNDELQACNLATCSDETATCALLTTL